MNDAYHTVVDLEKFVDDCEATDHARVEFGPVEEHPDCAVTLYEYELRGVKQRNFMVTVPYPNLDDLDEFKVFYRVYFVDGAADAIRLFESKVSMVRARITRLLERKFQVPA